MKITFHMMIYLSLAGFQYKVILGVCSETELIFPCGPYKWKPWLSAVIIPAGSASA